jgi:hypothetical protein
MKRVSQTALPEPFSRLVNRIDLAVETGNLDFLREARAIALCLAERPIERARA